MPSPRTHASLEPSAPRLSDKLTYGTALTFSGLATLFGIAAGSGIFYGLIIKAQQSSEPLSEPQAARTGPPKTPPNEYVKASKKLLVMQASAK